MSKNRNFVKPIKDVQFTNIKTGAAIDDSTPVEFEVLSSACKPGYAESGIINGLLGLIHDISHK